MSWGLGAVVVVLAAIMVWAILRSKRDAPALVEEPEMEVLKK
jgi:hypothetical protein